MVCILAGEFQLFLGTVITWPNGDSQPNGEEAGVVLVSAQTLPSHEGEWSCESCLRLARAGNLASFPGLACLSLAGQIHAEFHPASDKQSGGI